MPPLPPPPEELLLLLRLPPLSRVVGRLRCSTYSRCSAALSSKKSRAASRSNSRMSRSVCESRPEPSRSRRSKQARAVSRSSSVTRRSAASGLVFMARSAASAISDTRRPKGDVSARSPASKTSTGSGNAAASSSSSSASGLGKARRAASRSRKWSSARSAPSAVARFDRCANRTASHRSAGATPSSSTRSRASRVSKASVRHFLATRTSLRSMRRRAASRENVHAPPPPPTGTLPPDDDDDPGVKGVRIARPSLFEEAAASSSASSSGSSLSTKSSTRAGLRSPKRPQSDAARRVRVPSDSIASTSPTARTTAATFAGVTCATSKPSTSLSVDGPASSSSRRLALISRRSVTTAASQRRHRFAPQASTCSTRLSRSSAVLVPRRPITRATATSSLLARSPWAYGASSDDGTGPRYLRVQRHSTEGTPSSVRPRSSNPKSRCAKNVPHVSRAASKSGASTRSANRPYCRARFTDARSPTPRGKYASPVSSCRASSTPRPMPPPHGDSRLLSSRSDSLSLSLPETGSYESSSTAIRGESYASFSLYDMSGVAASMFMASTKPALTESGVRGSSCSASHHDSHRSRDMKNPEYFARSSLLFFTVTTEGITGASLVVSAAVGTADAAASCVDRW
mmetsp:Transcript_14700/g.58799  ORF Transcript_14700/g.58799 Transcript_14700/m.58799 type:complete len:631 (-) Transcript_14700:309-2201(-)